MGALVPLSLLERSRSVLAASLEEMRVDDLNCMRDSLKFRGDSSSPRTSWSHSFSAMVPGLSREEPRELPRRTGLRHDRGANLTNRLASWLLRFVTKRYLKTFRTRRTSEKCVPLRI